MAVIEFPLSLKQLLEAEHSHLFAPLRLLADRVGEILADNKLPFFPDYTDHGTDHINAVLESEVELVPPEVWNQSKKESKPRLLCAADAAVIIGATLLHDIAMHLQPTGFLELVSKGSRFKPLPWFKDNHEDHTADRPWSDLWEDYAREARRFSDRTLGCIIGLESSRNWKFESFPADTGQWERNHCLIIGEFIRRHHARLAHEIAIYGFPGLHAGNGAHQFPAMGTESGHTLKFLSDLIGLTARSHGTSLRVCQAYLHATASYAGTPRPMGTAVLYPMALLRVADYFQIDRQRAPAVLLQLRNPQSPISVQEWQKHQAVLSIDPATDTRAKRITVSEHLSLELFLQLRDLLSGLQSELDHSAAVLSEAYGAQTGLGLHQLSLTIHRVYSNLNTPTFRDSLPFVPDRIGFSADPNLLPLLVDPLYREYPGVGVRELMQNAVDAVRELHAWCNVHDKELSSLDLPDQESDVLIDFIRREDGTWFLRVQDKGIGMTSDTLQHYFLRAGVSFRQSAEWTKEFIDKSGKCRVLRVGRFGVGAFAIFLLGPTFRLWTRHVSSDKAAGCALVASSNSQLIEIQRFGGLPVGTRIEVDLANSAVDKLKLDVKTYRGITGPNKQTDWFCWDWPTMTRRVLRGAVPEILDPEYSASLNSGRQGNVWFHIQPEGYDAVYWTFDQAPALVCNGLVIAEPENTFVGENFGWGLEEAVFGWPTEVQLKRPSAAILDSNANLPLTIQRYELSQDTLPFVDELARDVTFSFIAHALVCGPEFRKDSFSSESRHPLSQVQISYYRGSSLASHFSAGLLRWTSTVDAMVPADPWLYSLLRVESCFVWGTFEDNPEDRSPQFSPMSFEPAMDRNCSMLHWHGKVYPYESSGTGQLVQILAELVLKGIAALGHELESSQVLVSSRLDFLNINGKHSTMGSVVWQRFSEVDARRPRCEVRAGSLIPSLPLEPLIFSMERAMRTGDGWSRNFSSGDLPDVFFVAELKTKLVPRSPESLIAKVWNECLGPQPIPFDPIARKALIDHGRQHPELKRHIEAWEEMKRTGSKWTKASG